MKRVWIALIVVVVAGAAAWWFMSVRVANAPTGPGCTEEAKLCLDGSYVGRTGPNCEFSACPDEVATSTTGGGGILPYNGGVRGTVMIGPTCPVVRDPPEPGCADKPYAVSIAVFRTGSNAPLLIGSSDKNGLFEFSLPPGSYLLKASSGTTMPSCGTVNVTVGADVYTTTTISCDSGIR